jgi:Domain of unknown function (DUF222)
MNGGHDDSISQLVPEDELVPEGDFDLGAHIDWAAASAAFSQDGAVDVLRPGPVLAAFTAQAVASAGTLTDDELIGALQAARRMAYHAAYQQVVVIAEFARRRQAQFEAAVTAGKPAGCRDGEFPGEELTVELVTTGADASARIDAAVDLTTRLPRTLAAMAAGLIDLPRAGTIAFYTHSLADEDVARTDEILAAAAPGKRYDQLTRKAAALEMKLAPEAVAARKKLTRQLDQRVEARREQSGNASLSGRELDTADVMASKAHIDAIAATLRDSGLIEGTLDRLRALALVDLTQGRDPFERIRPGSGYGGPDQAVPNHAGSDHAESEHPGVPHADVSGGSHGQTSRDGNPAGPIALPALINLLVPAGTLLGWGTAPAQAGGWGLLDADETRTLVQAAAKHPRTRWCMTITAPDGTAIAHGCAAGQRPWPPNDGLSPPGDPPTGAPGPRAPQAAQLLNLLQRLNITLEPLARDTCDHAHLEDRYVPSRRLKHLLRARTRVCTAPGCNAQASYCDIDHSIPYPDGPTCECNTNPKCRRHHRIKQAPDWAAAQPTPDTFIWTTPSGRTHTTSSTVYDI